MVKHLTNPLRERELPLGSLFSAGAQRLASKLDAELAGAGFTDLRAAHAPVFMAIDAEGTRVTTLARRSNMSKQSVGELLRYLGDRGYVTNSADPTDARARLVRLTELGWRAIETAEGVISEFDIWLATKVGQHRIDDVRAVLHTILEAELTEPDD